MNKELNKGLKKWSAAAAASVAFAMGGTANAAIQAGFDLDSSNSGTEQPELFLAIWDTTAPKTYIQDLGVNASTVDWNTHSQVFSIDSTVYNASTLNGSAVGNLRFAVFAAVASNDFDFGGLWSTAAPGDTNDWFTDNTVLDHGNAIVDLDDLSNAHNTTLATPDAYSENVATQGNSGGLVIPGTAFTGFFVDGAGQAVPGGAVTDALQWFEITWENFENNTLLRETYLDWTAQVENGVVTSVTYNAAGVGAPIPLPAGVWLLGSAVLGLVGIARRRAAVAA